VEPLHYVERKHAQGVLSFHVVRIFHARAAGTNAAHPELELGAMLHLYEPRGWGAQAGG